MLAQKTCRFSAAASAGPTSVTPDDPEHCGIFLPLASGRSGRSVSSRQRSGERRAGRVRRPARRRKSIKNAVAGSVATPLPLTIPINLVNIHLSHLLPSLCAVATKTPPLKKRQFRQSVAGAESRERRAEGQGGSLGHSPTAGHLGGWVTDCF